MHNLIKILTLMVVLFSFPTFAFWGNNELNLEPIKKILKDPYSAKFENIKEYGSGVVCGFVNSKNSMGAYAGPTPFYISNKTSGLSTINNEHYKAICVDLPVCLFKGKTVSQCSIEQNAIINNQIASIDENKSFAVKSQAEILCYRAALSSGDKADCVAKTNSCYREHLNSYIKAVACMIEGPLPRDAMPLLLEPARNMESKQNELKKMLNLY